MINGQGQAAAPIFNPNLFRGFAAPSPLGEGWGEVDFN